MGMALFSIDKIPDLTLNKYSSLEEGDVDGVLAKHRAFLRQIHRISFVSGLTVRWLYKFDPERQKGKRLEIFLAFGGEIPGELEEYIGASPLSPYYELKPSNQSAGALFGDTTYRCRRTLIKREKHAASFNRNFPRPYYYSVNKWKMNDDARLTGLLNLMRKADKSCAYLVSAKAEDLLDKIDDTNELGGLMRLIQENLALRIGQPGQEYSSQVRDENAEYSLKQYKSLVEDVAANPHFRVNIQAFADDDGYADMLLNAAVSEALDEGSYDAIREEGPFRGSEILSSPVDYYYKAHLDDEEKKPYESLKFWPVFFLLKELAPFCCLPALYPGETIEMPKETAPSYDKEGLFLGKDNDGHEVFAPLGNLPKHAFLAGVPGSGKTNSMLHIATELHKKFKIPFLIFEPAKKEYRALLNMPGMQDVTIFSPSAGTIFPLHINPFQFPEGIVLAEHIRMLGEVFMGAFPLELPMPILLDRAIQEVYADKNWTPYMKNRRELEYPTMGELYSKLEGILEKTSYTSDTRNQIKGILEVRIGSLLTREMGDIFDVKESTLAPEEWLTRSAVIELEALGAEQANFATLLITSLIRETLRVAPKTSGDDFAGDRSKPRHVIFFEEAHNLIGPVSEAANAEEGNSKISATAFIVKMLAEVRALREAIIIADQLPTKMAPEVIKNTSLKIGHRITAEDDRHLMGGTMSADGVQLERMSAFETGKALAYYEGLLKPFELTMDKWAKDEDGKDKDGWYSPPGDEELFALMNDNRYFAGDLKVSWSIMKKKFIEEFEKIERKYESKEKDIAYLPTVMDGLREMYNCLLRAKAYKKQNRECAEGDDGIESFMRQTLDRIFGKTGSWMSIHINDKEGCNKIDNFYDDYYAKMKTYFE